MNLFQYISENSNKIMELFIEHFFLFLISIIITTLIGVSLSIIATE